MALLQKAKELNIPRQNCMKTKQELEKAMKDTFIVYKEITFCARYPYMYKMLRWTSEAASNWWKNVWS